MNVIDAKFSAVILSAGYSSRMGSFKPFLKIGGRTLIERAVALFITAGLSDIIIVTGSQSEALADSVKNLPLRCVENKNFAAGMFTSVQAGVGSLNKCDAFFLLPVDIPLIRPQTIKYIINSYDPENDVIIPAFMGNGGHPPLISFSLRDKILAYSGEGGLAGFFEKTAKTVKLPVGDECILLDCDTPEDYQKLAGIAASKRAFTYNECMELLRDVYQVDEPIIRHSVGAARLARHIAKKLGFTDGELTVVEAAGLLHDICRKEKNHALIGAAEINRHGFPEVASAIETHMDITPNAGAAASIPEIIYLADKLMANDRLTSLAERFEKKLTFYGSKADAAIEKRFAAAREIYAKIQSIIDLDALLDEYGKNQ
ncbi:MAG: NTP transferase domain-containing protein [Leptospirales bacterium]|nr:NTP transferase domain-containing protein [Leptospirales bacterium]